VASFTYDALDRPTQTSIGGITVTSRYDAGGRLVERVDPGGSTTFTYDTQNRLVEERLPARRVNPLPRAALRGTVWAWGRNASGQFGDGSTTTRRAPVAIPALSAVVNIAAGANRSMASSEVGLVAWGRTTTASLGDTTVSKRKSPVPVVGLSRATKMAGGTSHTLAVVEDARSSPRRRYRGCIWSRHGGVNRRRAQRRSIDRDHYH
jgi:YD repeat-containing protein